MSRPLVSVVLPTHDRASTLRRAIDSVLGQSFRDLELIVVDDGSQDQTPQLLSAIEEPRLRRIRLPTNRGAAAARNEGIKRSRGLWIAFQDSDDEWLPRKLERQLSLADRRPVLRALGGRYRIERKSSVERVHPARLELGQDYEEELLDGACCITPVWMIERSLLDDIGGFDERLPTLEDWDLMLRASKRTPMQAVSEEVLIKRGAGTSLGADPKRRLLAMEQLLKRHGSRWRAHPRRHASFCLQAAYLSLIEQEPRRAVRFTLGALGGGGLTPRMWAEFSRACVALRAGDGEPRNPRIPTFTDR